MKKIDAQTNRSENFGPHHSPQPTVPQLMTIQEVAKILKVSDQAVRMMVKNGDLKGHRLPGNRGIYRIPVSAVNKMLNQ